MAGKITQIFATPIYYDRTAGRAALNEVLAGTTRHLVANYPSHDAFRAHRGGYYSDGRFLDSGLPGVDGVRAVIVTALDAYFGALGIAHTIVSTEVHGWVALTRPGDYQTPHVHSNSMLSGVYYCVMPDAPEPEGCMTSLRRSVPRRCRSCVACRSATAACSRRKARWSFSRPIFATTRIHSSAAASASASFSTLA